MVLGQSGVTGICVQIHLPEYTLYKQLCTALDHMLCQQEVQEALKNRKAVKGIPARLSDKCAWWIA